MSSTDYGISARRRALNIIWTAAGEYGFEPAFMAFSQDGNPDLYMNSIIGYVRKWYDPDIMEKLFSAIQEGLFKETYDGLLWIALENCAFQKEKPYRPVLKELRLEHARDFFRQDDQKSRQQWMAQNSLVYALQSARWNTVLGRGPGLANPRERKLFEELTYSGEWDARQIAEHTFQILHRYFHFSREHADRTFLLRLKNRFASFTSRLLPSRVMRTEDLTFARDGAGNGVITARKSKNAGPLTAAAEENNRIYIESCFGLPLYTREESTQIEELLCTGGHKDCHIYFTEGRQSAAENADIHAADASSSEDRSAGCAVPSETGPQATQDNAPLRSSHPRRQRASFLPGASTCEGA